MILRRGNPHDVSAITRIVFESLESFGITPDPKGQDSDVFTFGSNELRDDVVAEENGVVCGLVSLEPHEDGGWVSKLFVDKACRGHGVGSALLAHATDCGRARGYAKLGLRTRTVFEAAVRLYERHGWVRGPDPEQRGVGTDRTYFLRLL